MVSVYQQCGLARRSVVIVVDVDAIIDLQF